MIRDRTNLFVSFRQSYTHHPYFPEPTPFGDNDREALIGGHPQEGDGAVGEAIEMETLPPAYLDLATQLDKALESLRAKMAQLQPLHRQNALPGFDDRRNVERDIERLTVQITRGLHTCQDLVKQFGVLSGQETDHDARTLSENVKVAMAGKLQDTSTMFRKMQSSYLKELKRDQPVNAPGLLPMGGGSGGVDDDVAYSHAALEQQHALHDLDDTEVSQREREIERIAQGILEVADIFKDLQIFVIDQGTLVDRIDYNVEAMREHVKDADRELIQGAGYQRRTQKCKIILLLVLIIFGLVLYLLFRR